MPRYYFNLHDGAESNDPEGAEFADEDAAREYALECAREMVCADIKKGWLHLDHRIEVVGEDGRRVLTVTFRDAFEIKK